MAKTREIKGRIKAVKNIGRITRTMQTIATVRFQAAQRRATASQPYARKIRELVGELAAAIAAEGGEGRAGAAPLAHPLLRQSDRDESQRRELVLVVTSNRGLCGAYNANVLRKAMSLIRELPPERRRLEVIGKKGLGFFKFAGVEIDQFHSELSDQPTFHEIDPLAERYMQRFEAGDFDRVHVVSMAFQTMSRQEPEVTTLLPLAPPRPAVGGAGDAAGPIEPSVAYDYSPDPEKLLAELLPITVKTALLQRINEAVVSEQIARMIAMKSATDAASKMRKSLTRQFNRARQTAITTELTEIIGGAAALS